MKQIYLTLIFSLLIIFVFCGSKYNDGKTKDSIEQKVNDLLKKMTLEEKIELLGGTGFATKPIERLGIPELRMTDGPVGARWNPSNSYPSGLSMASTWNPGLINLVGSAIGNDVKAKGRNLILGPCVNIMRLPLGGRDFESFGEDPYLASRMAVDYIRGVQKENVAACVKHFACNNQEFERGFVNVIVDERAMNEIYLPAFKSAVKEADVMSVMSAYNKVNGSYCSENEYLLNEKLKNEWGFKGLVMSDWGAVHTSLPTAQSGLDLEMPKGEWLNKNTLLESVKKGELKESVVDDKVKRILTVMFRLGLFDKQIEPDSTLLKSKGQDKVAYQTALESIVLLKNNNSMLPLNTDKIKSMAVIGPSADISRTGGGGSAFVEPRYTVTPLQGLLNRGGDKIKISFAKGLIMQGDADPIKKEFFPGGIKAEFFNNIKLEGKPVLTRTDENINFWWNDEPYPEVDADVFSARWTGTIKAPESGLYYLDVTSDDGVRLYFEDKLVINDWTDHSAFTNTAEVKMDKGKTYKFTLEFYDNGGEAIVSMGWRAPGTNFLADAVDLARKSDIAIVFVGTTGRLESEGFDRPDMQMPNGQDELISEVLKVNKNTIVVLSNGGPVLVNKWMDTVPSLLETWFYGQEGGNAIADVIFGNYNPSGKLPFTWPVKYDDYSAYKTYKAMDSTTHYDDGIYVGYRHFDKYNIKPQFPFGYGLSYTTFAYQNIKIEKRSNAKVSFDVVNTGKVKGEEVVQLYVRDLESSIDRPYKELKRFSKIFLNPGESKKVVFELTKDDLSYFDVKTKSWVAEPGEFEVLAGSSSADIRLKDKFRFQ